ncbi:GNAT family N-acetyltransferase [Streptomyces alkaliterrae]|uniref:GNAT family N-acetyltransferase n=1 Tax=Streptomyces alkaliterrae TaxID=2213162 RepID=UPI001E52CB8F|nr:GNAT family N-acetyltransferase [Streptomyces alkaliterrae]
MLERAGDWAWGRTGTERLVLHVHERNERARAFYENRGFRATGRTQAHRGPAGGVVWEMAARVPSGFDGSEKPGEEAETRAVH